MQRGVWDSKDHKTNSRRSVVWYNRQESHLFSGSSITSIRVETRYEDFCLEHSFPMAERSKQYVFEGYKLFFTHIKAKGLHHILIYPISAFLYIETKPVHVLNRADYIPNEYQKGSTIYLILNMNERPLTLISRSQTLVRLWNSRQALLFLPWFPRDIMSMWTIVVWQLLESIQCSLTSSRLCCQKKIAFDLGPRYLWIEPFVARVVDIRTESSFFHHAFFGVQLGHIFLRLQRKLPVFGGHRPWLLALSPGG